MAAQAPAATASLQGVVRDARDQAIAGVTVSLKSGDAPPVRTGNTDSDGHYAFSGIPRGTYTLHAEKQGLGQTAVAALALQEGEFKTVDLKLSAASGGSAPTAAAPEFFDEPHFTVAGVSDTTNLGGHGSDTVVRTTASLARDTASLGHENKVVPWDAMTEASLREQVRRDPASSAANHQLGRLLAHQGKPRDAIPYLEQANRLNPSDFDSSYELAAARANAGDYPQAKAAVQTLLASASKPELHHLLADIEEKQGHPVEAVREYQQAAEANPSEMNLFDWGSELLLHAAPEPALEVFAKGNRLFPASSRMLVGLGVALYARGSSDQAIDLLCQASDLKPDDPTPYLFLGRVQSTATSSVANSAKDRLQRFLTLQPENALANYFYATSLWNLRGEHANADITAEVEGLLEKAVGLDSKLGMAYLLLGNVYSDEHKLPKAVVAYERAVAATPTLAQAHYRLAQAYRQAGNASKANDELTNYERISKENAEQTVRDRREIQEFVYTLRNSSNEKPQ